MPENPSDEWPRAKPEIVKVFCHRIGNLALMAPKANSTIDNRSFLRIKVPAYKQASFTLTCQIAELQQDCNEDCIDERQKRLAGMAVKVWQHRLKK
jgi:hypothetical protein